jgi:uncharacterized membrane protein
MTDPKVTLPADIEEKLPDEIPEEESFFLRLADKVSFGMGTPTNIGAWLLAVAIWIALGFMFPSLWTTSKFLPDWFTSTSWNFPLNTVTTLAELYIGFLVAAAANRTERADKRLLQRVEAMEALVLTEVRDDRDVTGSVHKLTEAIHKWAEADHTLLQEVHEHVTAIAPDAGHLTPEETDKIGQEKPKRGRAKPKT